MNVASKIWNSSPSALVSAALRRLRSRESQPAWLKIRSGSLAGVELLTDPRSSYWEEMASGEYDVFIYRELLSRHNPEGKIVWDVGAHMGYHSFAFAARGAAVVAFEPNAANVERLQGNIQRNARLGAGIRVLPIALSDHDGEQSFSQSTDLTGPSMGGHLSTATPPLTAQDYEANRFAETRVRTARIDTLISEGEREPDILKIDVEGAEALVLQGGVGLLKRRHPVLLIEVHHICLMFEVQAFLLKIGYSTKLLDRSQASPSRCFIMAEQAG